MNLEIILSISTLLSLVLCIFIFSKYINKDNIINDKNKTITKLESENIDLKEIKKNILSINIDDRVLFKQNGLSYDKGKSFDVLYELKVLDVSIEKIKVEAVDFSSRSDIANDPKHRNGLIDYMSNKWISKVECDLIIDTRNRRQDKIDELLKIN